MTSCSSCVTADIAFDCVWCNALSRCSDGFDRYRQEFLESDCHDEVSTRLLFSQFTRIYFFIYGYMYLTLKYTPIVP